MLKKRTALVAAFVLVAVPVALWATHAWSNYHWARTSNPFTLKVGDNVDSRWDGHLDIAISDWTSSSVLNLTKVAGATRPKSCRPTAGRIEVCNASYGGTGWLGIAQIWLSGGHISQGITKLNDTYFDTPTYNTPAWRNLVTCQEIGHDFGLAHQDENFDNPNLGSCMDYTNNPSTNQHPNQHDYAMLEQIYAHLDSTTTIGADMPQAMKNMSFDGPGQWGRLIAGSKKSGHSTYELDFGNGHKVITHVLWTLEARQAARDHHHDDHTE
jgi:hypothetical protein